MTVQAADRPVVAAAMPVAAAESPMPEAVTGRSIATLVLNTLAFTVCFAAWMLNGVLVTFLVDNRVYDWSASEMGWLIGIPVLTGSVMRLPVGMLTEKYGGRPVYAALMALSAIPMFLLSRADTYTEFALCSLGFGLSGASFAVGIAFTSVWFPRNRQGTALGIFGAGNAGTALTTLLAPTMLGIFTLKATQLDHWRKLPIVYAVALLVMAVIFFAGTKNKVLPGAREKSMLDLLEPLKHVRVWRFGLYYFLVFGGFVALAQWLVPYYVNVYGLSIVTAGLLTSVFSLPSGVIRAAGGFMSDRMGARRTFYWVLGFCAVCLLLLVFPKMDIESPGRGVMAFRGGVVTGVTPREIRLDSGDVFRLTAPPARAIRDFEQGRLMLLPAVESWHIATVRVGAHVVKKQVLARGVTHIFFQANVWVFTALVFIVGIAMGIGKAAVYRYIPDYFPADVGVVGGIVGVIGGLGGFLGPIIFGSLLDKTGLWTTTWMFLLAVTLVCIVWLNLVVRRMSARAPA